MQNQKLLTKKPLGVNELFKKLLENNKYLSIHSTWILKKNLLM
jgi:hypothetical protein